MYTTFTNGDDLITQTFIETTYRIDNEIKDFNTKLFKFD